TRSRMDSRRLGYDTTRAAPQRFKGRVHFARALIAPRRLLFEASVGDGLQRRWNARWKRRWRVMKDRRAHFEASLSLKRPNARRHLVQHDTQRPDVAAGVCRLATQLLGGHVWHRADNCTFLRQRSLCGWFRDRACAGGFAK